MAKHYTKLIIEINEDITSKVTAVKGDVNSRYLDVQLFNDSVPLDLTSHTVTMSAKSHPDSNFKVPINKFIDGQITEAINGRCQFKLETDILGQTGVIILQISVFSGEQEVLSTNPFNLYVIDSPRNDEQIEASNEFGALVVLFSEIQNALDDMHAIIESFGSPSKETTLEGIESFWGILEAVRSDVRDAVVYDAREKIGDPNDDADVPSLFGRLKELKTVLAGGEQRYETAGTYKFTFPTGLQTVELVAAGAGGGGCAGLGIDEVGGAGGGGGSCVKKILSGDEIPEGEITITIGKGGTGGKSKRQNGSDGSSTVVGSIVTVPGGHGGVFSQSSGQTPNSSEGGEPGGAGGGKGGGKSNNYVAGDGLYGKGGLSTRSPIETGGGGGGSYGNGGDGGTKASINGKKGTAGGGGGGGFSWNQDNETIGNGGDGADGFVLFRWGSYIGGVS